MQDRLDTRTPDDTNRDVTMRERQELVKKVRLIDIKTRKLVFNIFKGEYESAFRGSGMSFSEVREYQFEDDVRFIDWNVSARMDRPFVKVFQEERERSVVVLFDVSPSTEFGTGHRTKRDLAIEVAAVLILSAAWNHDKVGLILFSDVVEKTTEIKSGTLHGMKLIRELVGYQPRSAGTNLRPALEHILRRTRRRSVVLIIGDFLDEQDYQLQLKAAARKHDVVAIHIHDKGERGFENVGIVSLFDREAGRVHEFDTHDRASRLRCAADFQKHLKTTAKLFRSCKIDYIGLSTDEEYTASFVRFFHRRRKKRHT